MERSLLVEEDKEKKRERFRLWSSLFLRAYYQHWEQIGKTSLRTNRCRGFRKSNIIKVSKPWHWSKMVRDTSRLDVGKCLTRVPNQIVFAHLYSLSYAMVWCSDLQEAGRSLEYGQGNLKGILVIGTKYIMNPGTQ